MPAPNSSSERQVLHALGVMCGFAVLFLSLLSTNFFSADGNYRCFEVWHRQSLFFHGNNHLLYPLDVLLWTRLVSRLGFPLKMPLQFFAAVEVMNALAAAASLAIFYLLAFKVTESWKISTLSASALGLSNAFINQAVNGNEPMVGLMWSLLAAWIAVRASIVNSVWQLILAGNLFALSLATYRSMALLAPGVLLIVYKARQQLHVNRIAAFVLGGIVSTVTIYGWAYWLLGSRTLSSLSLRFIAPEDSRGFMSITLGKSLAVPLGLASGFTSLLKYFPFNGVGGILHGGLARCLALGVFPLLFCALLGMCLLVPVINWKLLKPAEQLGFAVASVCLAFTLVPVFLWDSIYDKLLVEPVGCIVFLCAISLNIGIRVTRRSVLPWFAAIAGIVVVCTSLPGVVQNHRQGTPDLSEVERFVHTLDTKDLVVGDWDAVSTVFSSIWADQRPDSLHRYESVWADNRQFFSFTTEANLHGADALCRLKASVSRTETNGGRIYFVNILDVPKPVWDAMLGRRFGVPYSSMESYRINSRITEKLRTQGGEIFVHMLIHGDQRSNYDGSNGTPGS